MPKTICKRVKSRFFFAEFCFKFNVWQKCNFMLECLFENNTKPQKRRRKIGAIFNWKQMQYNFYHYLKSNIYYAHKWGNSQHVISHDIVSLRGLKMEMKIMNIL